MYADGSSGRGPDVHPSPSARAGKARTLVLDVSHDMADVGRRSTTCQRCRDELPSWCSVLRVGVRIKGPVDGTTAKLDDADPPLALVT